MFIRKRDTMKEILEKWTGKFEVDGEIHNDLYDVNLNDGDDFHIKLLSKNRVVDDADDILYDIYV